MKNKIKVSHEVPRCLLKESLKFNDYQYALPHLLESDEVYRNHFIECKKKGVPIYLDNSLHELGYAIDEETLMKWVNILKPKILFIPDVWEEAYKTMELAEYWSKIKLPKKTTPVAIVQAKEYTEAVLSIKRYKQLGYKFFAFSYGAEYYSEIVPHPNKDIGKALGRISVISRLYNQGVLTKFDRVHLLGCSSPFEFSLYRGIECIKSLDTSNPIMMALEGKKYTPSLVMDKPKANMNNDFDISLDKVNLDLIQYNVNKFKNFIEV